MEVKGNKEQEYIIYEIVTAKTFSDAEKLAKSNDIQPSIDILQDFIDDNVDYDALREQVLEEEGQNQEDIKNDMD